MAEIGGMLAAAVLKAAAGKVAAAAADRIMLQWRFGEDLEDMRDTLESIEAVLEDAERRSIEDASVRLWLKRLTRASYAISDTFDEFELNNVTRKLALRKFKVLNPCFTLDPDVGMSGSMKKVREKLEKISNNHHKFSFIASGRSYMQQVIDERATSSKVIETDIFGRNQEKRKVMALLTNASTSSEFIILPIYGIGGIGKTTLAQLLFNDTHFKDYEKAWVYVSQTFDLKKIDDSLRSQLEIEQSLLEAGTHEPDADPPACKKILIVLDDLWENSDFRLDDLKHSLKKIGNKCKVHVIVTTRDAGIAQKIQTTNSHMIEPLSLDICWTIIKQIVDFEDRADKERLEDMGKEIAMKCGGVALAARALGYMLRSRNLDGWVSVKDSGIWNVSTSGYTTSPYDNVLASLKLSYSSILPYLRLCFAYCAIFPKGHKMAKHDLIYQWAALGFIKSSDEVSTWQHGENCVKQLMGMSFLQHSKSPLSYGQHEEGVTLFTMHDLVHDLARSILGDEVLDASRKRNIGGSSCRYVSLADCSEPLISFVTYPDKIRALRYLGSAKIGRCAAGLSAAKYLRVLDLGECSIKKLPSSIGQLKLLRYLNAPGMKGRMIPNCITKLSRLIYLNLRGSSGILALPESIGEMKDLKYLDLSGCAAIRELPKSFEKLKKLVHLDISKCYHIRGVSNCLEKLIQLKYLNLSYCENIGEVPASLDRLTELQYLNLSCSSYFLGGADGDVLGTLSKLEYLNLSSTECLVLEQLPEALGSFIELKYLDLSGCYLLKELPRSFGKLKNLVHLDLSNCFRLNRSIPEALCDLTRLRYLNLSREPDYYEDQPPLKGLPEVIKKLTELRYLNLSGCMDYTCSPNGEISDHIENFLDIISTISNINHLELSYNYTIYTIPDSFCSLTKLHTLDLTGCRNLRRLPENIGGVDSLKFLIVGDCSQLDMSTLRSNKSLISLPNFMVHAAEGERSSNLLLLKDFAPPELNLTCLENVKSVEETRIVELRSKQSMVKLTLDWTSRKKGYVEDMELLRELVPPSNLEEFGLRGYNSVTFPAWLMDIAIHLPNLVRVNLTGLSHCSCLPPLGQLPNLQYLHITEVPGITKIDRSFCGGVNAFARLEELFIENMESLEEWNVAYSYGEGVADEFIFASLNVLKIDRCRRLKLNPCPARVKGTWHIVDSDSVLLHQGQRSAHTSSSSSSALVTCLNVKSCKAPMHQWKLLHCLRGLNELVIEDCDDLSGSSEIIGTLSSVRELTLDSRGHATLLPQWLGDLTSLQTLRISGFRNLNNLPECMRHLSSLQLLHLYQCMDIQAPEWLGDLVSLKELYISNCRGILSLPESMQQLTNLEKLSISACPALEQWCKLEENKMKIVHIKEVRVGWGNQNGFLG
ncbi:unnamed protein product [Urochloa decumbens]|uniref:Uncharacterized protein n=1 Tax=Urochloa decumbens TaxID=240449 RepID=A0ABC8YW15_9POAL